MKRILPILLALCLLLCACGGSGEETPTTEAAASQPVETTAFVQDTVPTQTEEVETEPTEQVQAESYHNPLTGEPMDAPCENRPIAVVINNTSAALPHHGVSQADILYEILAEGAVTRCLAVYSDISQVEKIGSVRSARTYLVNLAYSYDAILAHAGDSVYAHDRFKELNMDHLDGIAGSSAYFYRDQTRLNSGYALEHTLFTSGENLLAAAAASGYDLTVDPDTSYGLNFAEDAVPEDGESAAQITIQFIANSKTTTMTYNTSDDLYYGTEYGEFFTDGNTDALEGFRNVFVLRADTWVGSSEGHRFVTLTGSGDGYFACGGKIVPIQWHRDSDEDCFTYTLTDGTPLTQGVGTSYIAVIPISGVVNYQ